MLDWLRGRLRSWLLAENHETSAVLTVLVPGREGPTRVEHVAFGVVGMRLSCYPFRGGSPNQGVRLVGEGDVDDRERFWRLWRSLGGRTEGWSFSDGTPFDPGR
jgi:hypothetical protein